MPWLVLIILALCVVAAGCGGQDASGSPATVTITTGPAPTVAEPGADPAQTIRDYLAQTVPAPYLETIKGVEIQTDTATVFVDVVSLPAGESLPTRKLCNTALAADAEGIEHVQVYVVGSPGYGGVAAECP